LVLSLDEDELSQTWLYVAISLKRFQELSQGQLEIRDAYLKAEDNIVLKVITHQDGYDTVDLVYCTDIPEQWLPFAGEFLLPSALATVTPNEEVYFWHNIIKKFLVITDLGGTV
jgi:hypothetical protein